MKISCIQLRYFISSLPSKWNQTGWVGMGVKKYNGWKCNVNVTHGVCWEVQLKITVKLVISTSVEKLTFFDSKLPFTGHY